MKRKVAILGANGQVGSELCLFLARFPGIVPIAITRSAGSASFLRLCGIECRYGSIDSPESAACLLDGCDTVIDLILPSGGTSAIKVAMRRIIESIMIGCPAVTDYVYMSTMSVHRLAPEQASYRRYARVKLYGESCVMKLAKAHGKKAHVLRLAQVHGVLQAVGRKIRKEMRTGRVSVPAGPSNTVFVYTIAEAVDLLLKGKATPGCYTLTSNPEWTWSDIHRYYCRQLGIESEIVTHPAPVQPHWRHLLDAFTSPLKTSARGVLYSYRDLIDDVLASIRSGSGDSIRAWNAKKRVRAEVRQSPDHSPWSPYPEEYRAPGQRLPGLGDSRMTMEEPEKALRDQIAALAFGGLIHPTDSGTRNA